MIVSGENPICVDEVIATLMGFDVKKIPTLAHLRTINDDCEAIGVKENALIVSNDIRTNQTTIDKINRESIDSFEAADGWKGFIEL